jgi:hypothetical protein
MLYGSFQKYRDPILGLPFKSWTSCARGATKPTMLYVSICVSSIFATKIQALHKQPVHLLPLLHL